MSALEFEIEERESAVDVGALLADVVAVRRCACGRPALGDELAHREDGCRPMVGLRRVALSSAKLPIDASTSGRVDARSEYVERVAFPAPEVTSRDPWDGVTGCPGVVLQRAESARKASWAVRVQRSRGCAPHASHGAAGAVKWRYAVRFARAGRGAYAVHDGTAWKSVMLWGRDRTMFALASVTDLGEYIAAGGEMSDAWYDAILSRIAEAERRESERKDCDRGVHSLPRLEAFGPVYGEWCERCNKTWPLKGEPWKKTRRGTGEAL